MCKNLLWISSLCVNRIKQSLPHLIGLELQVSPQSKSNGNHEQELPRENYDLAFSLFSIQIFSVCQSLMFPAEILWVGPLNLLHRKLATGFSVDYDPVQQRQIRIVRESFGCFCFLVFCETCWRPRRALVKNSISSCARKDFSSARINHLHHQNVDL